MPLSIFRGRPWPAVGEPLWLDEDRDLALALVADERDSCPGCGELVTVSTDPESEGAYTSDAVRCHACAAQTVAAGAVDDQQGLLVTFTRRPDPKGA